MLRCRSRHLLHHPSPGHFSNVELSHYVKSYGISERLKLKNSTFSPNVCTVFEMFTWKWSIPIFSLRTHSLVCLQVAHTGKWHDFEENNIIVKYQSFIASPVLSFYSFTLPPCVCVWWAHIACGKSMLTVWTTQSHCVCKAAPPCPLCAQAFYSFQVWIKS